jgi:hypothetical protein
MFGCMTSSTPPIGSRTTSLGIPDSGSVGDPTPRHARADAPKQVI